MKKPVSFTRHQAVGAYRRWEPPAFDAPSPGAAAPEAEIPHVTDVAKVAEAPQTALPPGLKLPTAVEIEHIHEEARRGGFEEGHAEGHQTGHRTGHQAGLEEGRAEGRQAGFEEGRQAGYDEGRAAAGEEAERLRDVLARLDRALTRLDADIAEELLALAIELARKVLQHTLAVEPEAVVSAIRNVLQYLPQTRTQIHLNPEDVALARKHLGEILEQEGHLLIEDDSVSRGGCRVESAGAQIDATMETRWRRVLESLGREHAPWVAAAAPRKTRTSRTRTRDKSAGSGESLSTSSTSEAEPEK